MPFGRKKKKYESADISIEIAKNNLKLVHNSEMARLLKIYTDYSHQTEKFNFITDYENILLSLKSKKVLNHIGFHLLGIIYRTKSNYSLALDYLNQS